MNELSQQAVCCISAVQSLALELGLTPLSAEVAARVSIFGIGALVECTLALDQPYATDVNVRGVLHAMAIKHATSLLMSSASVAIDDAARVPELDLALL